MRTRREAFSLVELLVVIAIIAVLVGMLLPAIQRARESAQRSQCQNNLKQLVLATQACHDAYQYLPPATGQMGTGATGPNVSVMVWLLPFLEQEGLFNAISAAYAATPPKTVTSVSINGAPAVDLTTKCPTVIKSFQCPSDTTIAAGVAAKTWTNGTFASYGFNGEVFGTISTSISNGVPSCGWGQFTSHHMIPGYVSDGLSATIFFTEKLGYCSNTNSTSSTSINGVPGATATVTSASLTTDFNSYGPTRWASGNNSAPCIACANQSSATYTTTTTGSPGTTTKTLTLGMSPTIIPQFSVTGNNNCYYFWPSTQHNVLNVGMGDGSVHAVAPTVSQLTFNIALVPNDKLSLGSDW